MTSAHFVKKARKDYPDFGIKKGDSYWYWEFAFGPTYKSKTRPKPSQLTRSEFLSTYLSIGETLDAALQAAACSDDIQHVIDDAKSSIDELRDDTQGKLDNMPQQLQDADTGQLLQERIDQLDQWLSDLDSVDLSTLQDLESEEKDEIKDKKAEDTSDDVEEVLTTVKDEIFGVDPGIS